MHRGTIETDPKLEFAVPDSGGQSCMQNDKLVLIPIWLFVTGQFNDCCVGLERVHPVKYVIAEAPQGILEYMVIDELPSKRIVVFIKAEEWSPILNACQISL
jgi:hypothetical protein